MTFFRKLMVLAAPAAAVQIEVQPKKPTVKQWKQHIFTCTPRLQECDGVTTDRGLCSSNDTNFSWCANFCWHSDSIIEKKCFQFLKFVL